MDINADMGEVPEALANGSAERLVGLITSANIACGGHAGDEESMSRMIALCTRYEVGIGAHPGYPHRESMGREEMLLSSAEISQTVYRQVSVLAELAEKAGRRINHVKPHGALYNMAISDERIAIAIAEGVRKVDGRCTLVGMAGSKLLDVWRRQGFSVIGEAFADRRYQEDGVLRSRRHPDALITDPALAADQALTIARDHKVISLHGQELSVQAQTICIHSDTPNAIAIAKRVREVIRSAGIDLTPMEPYF